MGVFTKVSANAFDEFQTDAGVLLKAFDLETATFNDEDIVCATTGGINPVCAPSFSDWGEDVDNCPTNTKELKHLDSWDCSLSFTSLSATAETIRLSLGAADITDETGASAIIPRSDLKDTDFADIWWVGDHSSGGYLAVRLIDALSTGGFSLQTTKDGKGQLSVTLTGHRSIENTEKVPMEFYVSTTSTETTE